MKLHHPAKTWDFSTGAKIPLERRHNVRGLWLERRRVHGRCLRCGEVMSAKDPVTFFQKIHNDWLCGSLFPADSVKEKL